ncbi:hypothetical protein JYJ95_16185 [Corallococcus exiguus]|uniref:hypothetical protein n=1 Tax=Corallococcus exiguus TaxID=83462 RepID=UPI001A8F2D52|nr:hypothetical protein [Corallococcus exiguus]MBN8468060.1 hypothetical protein [Corallococcus exiguus]
MDPKIFECVRMGFELSYSNPDAQAGIPLDEPWMSYYLQGMEAGKEARIKADAKWDGPAIGPDLGGEDWEAYQKHLKNLLEPLFHEHEPHIEVEPPEIVVGR